jgi:phage replication-related protein YjqB (UPF0714/DUF867 family)
MRTTGFLYPGVLLSLVVSACAPVSDSTDPALDERVASSQGPVTFTGRTAQINDVDLDDDEHCLMPADLIDDFPVNRQVRLSRTDGSVTHLALCTVVGESTTANVQMTTGGLSERLGASVTVSGVTVATLGAGASVAAPQATMPAAYSGFTQDVREFSDRPAGALVAYTAPHGRIEKQTGEQANRILTNRTAGREAFWVAGYHTSAGSIFSHLHITSSEISEVSFGGLGTFITTPIRYAVSFHGFNEPTISEAVLVGGLETASFRKGVAEILNADLAGTGFVARHDLSPSAYAEFRGQSPDNFVNRMAVGGRGLQLEQSLALRNDAVVANAVADSVKSVYDCLLDTADTSATTGGTFNSGGTGYTAGKCRRFITQVQIGSNVGNVTVDAGKASGCSAGTAHVDVYRLRADSTWERLGGGSRTYGAFCSVTNDPGYDPVAGVPTPATLRVEVKSSTQLDSPDTASVRVMN